MAKHGQQPADGGDDSSCPRSQPNQSRSDHGDESRGTSSVFPSHQTRPLFGSLEEAHNRITRPQPSGTSTSVTDDTASSGSGDDFILKDMRRLSPVDARAIYTNVGYPVTRAFSRSVTDGVNRTVDGQALVPSPLLVQKQLDPDPRKNGEFASPPTSKTAPVAWQELGEPWKIPPTRFPEAQAFAEANTSNQPPPYSPKSELERTIGYHDPAAEGSFAVESTPQPGLAPSPGGNRCAQQHEAITMLGRAAEEEIRSPPQIALPEDPPFHPSNPFAASARLTASQTVLRVISVSPSPESPFPNQPLHLSDSQDDRARIGGDLGVASGVGYDSEPGVGSGESKVPKMLRPPARMHSARRKERSRQSLVSSSRSSVIGGGVTEGSEDDPFHYDSVFLRPSREREFGTNDFKQCGSSIANYSDCEAHSDAALTNTVIPSYPRAHLADGPQPATGPFNTQPHVVHPPANNNKPQDLRYRKHNINKAPVPVFVPEQRFHRVNGLFQDTSRPVARIPPASGSQDQNRSQIFGSSALRAPFRRINSKRSSFRDLTLHQGMSPRHPFTELESDDSSLHELQPVTSQPDTRRTITSGERWSSTPRPDRNQERSFQSDTTDPQRQIPSQPNQLMIPVTGLSSPARMARAHLYNRNRGDSIESGASISLIDSSQFELIPLEVAQQRQAVRRASGQEDQTLTGRARLESMRNPSCNTNASQFGSQIETPASAVTPNARNVSRFVSRGFAQASSPLSGRDENDANALIPGDDTRPTISTTTGSDLTITTIHQPDGRQHRIFYPSPRLYPWDRLHRGTAAQKSTDRSLQRITGQRFNSLDNMERGAVHRRVHDTEAWLSDNAHARRRSFFFIVALLSIFPFVSPIALCGGFNSALSWHTRGEVDRFSTNQRRCLMVEAIIAFFFVIATIVFVVIKYGLHN
ncbi:hypothetical protein F5883DRAFT_671717 [Diaporthe sp. PMI_573]|nr:hypothetical protein F5883DRAFT_671717 [Diaporthaceae sp. PMI_573]